MIDQWQRRETETLSQLFIEMIYPVRRKDVPHKIWKNNLTFKLTLGTLISLIDLNSISHGNAF